MLLVPENSLMTVYQFQSNTARAEMVHCKYLRFLDRERIIETDCSFTDYLWNEARLEHDAAIMRAMWEKVRGRDLAQVLSQILYSTIWDWNTWDGIKPVQTPYRPIEDFSDQPYGGLQDLEDACIIFIWDGRVSVNMTTDEWRDTSPSGTSMATIRKHFMKHVPLICHYCGAVLAPDNFEIDHVVPRSRGGGTFNSNLVVACSPCNMAKHDRTPEEWLR
jgi:hypothetical protein